MRELDPIIVAGNHDWAVADKIDSSYFNVYAKEAIIWTKEQLSDEERDYLANLKLTVLTDEFTVCHSTIFRPDLFAYIQTSFDAHMSFQSLTTQIGFVGHSHIPVTFLYEEYISFTLEN